MRAFSPASVRRPLRVGAVATATLAVSLVLAGCGPTGPNAGGAPTPSASASGDSSVSCQNIADELGQINDEFTAAVGKLGPDANLNDVFASLNAIGQRLHAIARSTDDPQLAERIQQARESLSVALQSLRDLIDSGDALGKLGEVGDAFRGVEADIRAIYEYCAG